MADENASAEAAQTAWSGDLFSWVPSDKSLDFIATLYGNEHIKAFTGLDIAAGGEPTVIVGMLGIVNVAIIGLAVIWLIYQAIFGVGMMTTDKTRGELANNGFSSFMTVGRVGLGASALIPVAGGLSILQIFILWVIVLGTGVANSLQTYAIDKITTEGGAIHAPAKPSSKAFIGNLAETLVCKETINNFLARKPNGASRWGWDDIERKIETLVHEDGSRTKVAIWGNSKYPDLCGGYRVTDVRSLRASSSDFIAATSDESLEIFADTLNAKYVSALDELEAQVTQIALSAISNYMAGHGSRELASLLTVGLEQTALAYEIKVRAAVAQALKEDEIGSQLYGDFVENATKDGWLHFGAWFYRISNLNSQIESIAKQMPIGVAPDYSVLPKSAHSNIAAFGGFMRDVLSDFNNRPESGLAAQRMVEATIGHDISTATALAQQIDQAVYETHTTGGIETPRTNEDFLRENLSAGIGGLIGAVAAGAAVVAITASLPVIVTAAAVGGLAGVVGGGVAADAESAIKQGLSGFATAIQSGFIIDETLSPIVQVKKLGDSILASIEGVIMILLGIAGFGVVAGGLMAAAKRVAGNVGRSTVGSITSAGSGGGLVTSIMGGMTALLVMAIISVAIFGAVMSVYIPMVPVIIWVTAVMGWLAMTIEVMIAAPLWAVAHMQTKGEGLVSDGAKQGWIILLNVFLRPAMMVIALVFAMIVSTLGVGLVNELFFGTIPALEVGSVKSFIGTIALIFVYMTLVLSVMHSAYYLVHYIPNSVTRFLGGGAETLGEGFREGEKSSQQQIIAIGNKSEGVLQRGPGRQATKKLTQE